MILPVERIANSTGFSGSCLCGAVRFSGSGLRDVVYCHCSQCRRAHGTVAAYSATAADSLVMDEDAALRWFEASGTARRGFCKYCGSTLLWAPRGKNYVCVAAGAIDQGPAIAAARHVYVADRAAYEFIGDGLPGSPGSMHDEPD